MPSAPVPNWNIKPGTASGKKPNPGNGQAPTDPSVRVSGPNAPTDPSKRVSGG